MFFKEFNHSIKFIKSIDIHLFIIFPNYPFNIYIVMAPLTSDLIICVFFLSLFSFPLSLCIMPSVFQTWKLKVKSLSRVRLFATPWTVAHQALPSMVFSRQEYWSGLPFPSPGDLPDPGIEPRSPTLEADTLTSEPPGKPKLKWI